MKKNITFFQSSRQPTNNLVFIPYSFLNNRTAEHDCVCIQVRLLLANLCRPTTGHKILSNTYPQSKTVQDEDNVSEKYSQTWLHHSYIGQLKFITNYKKCMSQILQKNNISVTTQRSNYNANQSHLLECSVYIINQWGR